MRGTSDCVQTLGKLPHSSPGEALHHSTPDETEDLP